MGNYVFSANYNKKTLFKGFTLEVIEEKVAEKFILMLFSVT